MKTLSEIRQDKRMSQKEMANLCHLTQQQISKYENGKQSVPMVYRKHIAEQLEMDVSEIQFDIKTKKPDEKTVVRKTNIERALKDKTKDEVKDKPEIKKKYKSIDFEIPIDDDPNIDEFIYEIGLEYVDSVFKNINLLSTDREKFTRLADFKACITFFNQDTLNHVDPNNNKKSPQTGADNKLA